MDHEALGRRAYQAYGDVVHFKNYQGLPMPLWDDLSPAIQNAWKAAATVNIEGELIEGVATTYDLNERELAQINHAMHYADHHAASGVPGHGQFVLIAKLARFLGLER